MIKDDLGQRMKEYEAVPKIKLMKRTPVAIRIDGKAFHTFTKGFQKPFDMILVTAMQETTKYLCENIQGCVFGYTQSDEITLILIDYQTFETEAWFDYQVQKICSISASMATMKFNQIFSKLANNSMIVNKENIKRYQKALEKGAMFDARCFNISKDEVCNLVYWRQLDAMRNSVLLVGQRFLGHSCLQNKNCTQIKEMLVNNPDTPAWEDYPIFLQRGTAVYKENGQWIIDKKMPKLVKTDRNYIEKFIDIN